MSWLRIALRSTPALLLLACSRTPDPSTTPQPLGEGESVPDSATDEVDAAAGGEQPGDAGTATPETPPAPEQPAPGRMAFTPCEEPRKQACTREYRQVCAEVDNGVRCIQAPCPSTDKRNYSNPCMACADAKTVGYWPVACEQLGNDTKP